MWLENDNPMIDIAMQLVKGWYVPHSVEDQEKSLVFKPNQILRAKISGFQKQRSVTQLGLFMACCKLVADNTNDRGFDTMEKVKFQVKVALHFVDEKMIAVRPDGTVVFQYRSLGFDNMKHMEACFFFERAFDFLAVTIGLPLDQLIEEAQRLMLSQRPTRQIGR